MSAGRDDGRGAAGGRPRLGQHFLADPNLLAAIVREARLRPGDVVLEVGGGEGALTRKLAPEVAHVHVVELDAMLVPGLENLAASAGNVTIHPGDAMKVGLGSFRPPPGVMVANLPYSIATPLLIRTVAELAGLSRWTVMVQREIADRLRASPGSRSYGLPSAIVQLSCDVKLLRDIDPAVFVPRPRVRSALLCLERHSEAPSAEVARLIRAAFAHRRKPLASSVALALAAERPGREGEVKAVARDALRSAGHDERVRAEALAPDELAAVARSLSAAIHRP